MLGTKFELPNALYHLVKQCWFHSPEMSAEICFLKKMQRVQWIDRQVITQQSNKKWKKNNCRLIKEIRYKVHFWGHVMRRNKPENLVSTVKLNGKKNRRKRNNYLDGLVTWHNRKKNEDWFETPVIAWDGELRWSQHLLA